MSKKDKWKRTGIIIAIIVSILLCIGNILLAHFFKTDGANIFAAVSGWVSGIATIILGVTAVIQNRKYTLASLKKEIKEELYDEKKEIVGVLDNIAQYSRLTKPLNNLVVAQGKQSKLSLDAKIEIDSLREQLMATSTRVQLFRYIPENMVLIVEKINEMIMSTYEEYQDAMDHEANDKLLSIDVKKITDKAVDWIRDIASLRNKAIKELGQARIKVDNSKSINQIEELQKEFDKEMIDAQEKTQKEIDKAVEKRKEKKEKING